MVHTNITLCVPTPFQCRRDEVHPERFATSSIRKSWRQITAPSFRITNLQPIRASFAACRPPHKILILSASYPPMSAWHHRELHEHPIEIGARVRLHEHVHLN